VHRSHNFLHTRGLTAFTLFTSFVAVTSLTGCGDRDGGMRVWGEVTYDSKPVTEGMIDLVPAAGHKAPAAGGLIKDGRYDMPARKGPRAGVTYLVSIEAMEKTGKKIVMLDKTCDETRQFIPAEYNARSTLEITVSKKATENQKDFILEKPGLPKP
jgi:hypothetical protein